MENLSENLNISDVMKPLSAEEKEIIQKGKNHWSLEIFSKRHGGYVDSKTIKELIDKVIENTWTQAKVFYENRSEDNNVNALSSAVIESTTGYSCPNCGAICSDKTLISRTDSEFEEYPDPHYSWDETHKCQKCETLYLLHNGT